MHIIEYKCISHKNNISNSFCFLIPKLPPHPKPTVLIKG